MGLEKVLKVLLGYTGTKKLISGEGRTKLEGYFSLTRSLLRFRPLSGRLVAQGLFALRNLLISKVDLVQAGKNFDARVNDSTKVSTAMKKSKLVNF